MKRKILFGLVLLAFNLALLEAASFTVGNWFVPGSVLFNPRFSPKELEHKTTLYGQYLAARDPHTGWPFARQPESGEFRDHRSGLDAIGSRPIPAFPDPHRQEACVSLFGDSFTFGAEVDEAQAWGNLLATKLGCRVNNFGVNGYGSDQAFLRFAHHPDRAPVVFLNHLSENILRNVSQYRDLMLGYDRARNIYSFKPRFTVDGSGQLELIALPAVDSSDFADLVYNPEDYLEHEYFLPGGESGIGRHEFPYTASLLKILGHFHVQARLGGYPWYLPFYDESHSSGGLEVTAGILAAFDELARERGQQPVPAVIPMGPDLVHFAKHGIWPYQNLLDRMKNRGIDVLDFGPGIMERLDGADPCSLFDICRNHYNELGYEMLAEIAFGFIRSRNLLEPAESGGLSSDRFPTAGTSGALQSGRKR